MGKTLFSPITWLNIRRSAPSEKVNWVHGFQKCWSFLHPGDRSRDTAHAHWPFEVMVMWSDWVTHNSGTDNCRKLKIAMCIGSVICHSSDIAKVKRSMSQGQMKRMHKNMKYMPQTSSDSRIYRSYKKSRSPDRMTRSDFYPEAPK